MLRLYHFYFHFPPFLTPFIYNAVRGAVCAPDLGDKGWGMEATSPWKVFEKAVYFTSIFLPFMMTMPL